MNNELRASIEVLFWIFPNKGFVITFVFDYIYKTQVLLPRTKISRRYLAQEQIEVKSFLCWYNKCELLLEKIIFWVSNNVYVFEV